MVASPAGRLKFVWRRRRAIYRWPTEFFSDAFPVIVSRQLADERVHVLASNANCRTGCFLRAEEAKVEAEVKSLIVRSNVSEHRQFIFTLESKVDENNEVRFRAFRLSLSRATSVGSDDIGEETHVVPSRAIINSATTGGRLCPSVSPSRLSQLMATRN